MDENRKIKGEAGGIPVFCAFDNIVPIDDVKPNPKNPNKHPDEQIELLAKIIQMQGWRAPITVSTLSGLVVRGHGRLMAAIHAGLSHVPVDYQHYDSEDDEISDLIADNRIAELAEIDKKMLEELFSGLDDEIIDASLTGYTENDIEEIKASLQESVMEDIDEIKSDSELEYHRLKFDSTDIPMTEEEYIKLRNALDSYVDENSVVFGFVGWLLDD